MYIQYTEHNINNLQNAKLHMQIKQVIAQGTKEFLLILNLNQGTAGQR